VSEPTSQFRRMGRVLLGLVAALACVQPGVAAAAELNVTGVWHAVFHCTEGKCPRAETPAVIELEQGVGFTAVSGAFTAEQTGGTGTITGSLSGRTLAITGKGHNNNYEAHGNVTISEDGLSWSGTYGDSKGSGGSLTATREASSAPGARPDRANLACSIDLTGLSYNCTVIITDISGQSPQKVPSGTVTFTASQGSFTSATCTLAGLRGSTTAASCSVTYMLPIILTTGPTSMVQASYSGDSVFAPQAGINAPPVIPQLRPSATDVVCNIGVASTASVCVAAVADANTLLLTPSVPTGTVSFTATTGTLLGTSCSLINGVGFGAISRCAVPYLPPPKGLPIGAVGYVVATYSGDTLLAPSTVLAGGGFGSWPGAGSASAVTEGAATTVNCPAGSRSCAATVNLWLEKAAATVASGAVHAVNLGSTSVRLRGGQRKRVKVSLNRLGRKLLASHGSVRVLVTVKSGAAVIRTQRVVIKRGRKHG